MFRSLLPLISTFLAVMLDTAVIPVFYSGVYLVPVTLAVILCIGLLLGRLRGMLYGMIGGLLIDITAGTLGAMTFFFIAGGFLIGLIIDESSDKAVEISTPSLYIRRAVVTLTLYFVGELVIYISHYFQTAVFEWSHIELLLIRCGTFTALTVALSPLLKLVYLGRKKPTATDTRKRREVKHF